MKTAYVSILLLGLAGCGGQDSSTPPEQVSSHRSGAGPANDVAPAAAMGERKSYEFRRDGGVLSASSKNPVVASFTSTLSELRLRDITLSFDVEGPAGQLYRLYRAAFGRVADVGGLGFWKSEMDHHGATMADIAVSFLQSPESRAIYGFPVSDDFFIEKLYANVLGRAPDSQGKAYWLEALGRGVPRATILLSFAESTENKSHVAALLAQGIGYAEPGIAYLPVSEISGPTDVPVGLPFQLDGTRSSDANNDRISYTWNFVSRPAGSNATITPNNASQPGVLLDRAGRYEISLSTDDGKAQSFSAARLVIEAHEIASDTGIYQCKALTDTKAQSLYWSGATYLDRNKDGIPCNAADLVIENTPPTPVADTGRYKCSTITHSQAQQLYQQGHTYLDRDKDGKPCEANDISIETYVPPVVIAPPVVSTPSTGQCWVNGYRRKNGTYVHGYWRHC